MMDYIHIYKVGPFVLHDIEEQAHRFTFTAETSGRDEVKYNKIRCGTRARS